MWFIALLVGGVAGFFVGTESALEGFHQSLQKGEILPGLPIVQEAVRQGKLPPEAIDAFKRGEFLPRSEAPAEVRGWTNTRGRYR